MKKMTLLLSLLSASAFAEISDAPVKNLYVPIGFDNNDSAEVVVTGEFPSPCYGRNSVAVKIKDYKVDIKVTAIRRDTKSALCPQMVVPYKEVVSLGNLQGGDYEINVNNVLHKKLYVTESTSNSIDDHLYAAIDYIEKVSKTEYVLHGWNYSFCNEVDKVLVVSNEEDTLSVLPIMKNITEFCPRKLTPVSIPVKFDFSSLKTLEPLIHVRTMDGRSNNTILNLEQGRK